MTKPVKGSLYHLSLLSLSAIALLLLTSCNNRFPTIFPTQTPTPTTPTEPEPTPNATFPATPADTPTPTSTPTTTPESDSEPSPSPAENDNSPPTALWAVGEHNPTKKR